LRSERYSLVSAERGHLSIAEESDERRPRHFTVRMGGRNMVRWMA
jgi:hypothetical protein